MRDADRPATVEKLFCPTSLPPDDVVVAGRYGIAARQPGGSDVHLTARHGRIDPERGLRARAKDPRDDTRGLRHGVAHRHHALPTHERDTVDVQLPGSRAPA